MFKFCFFDINSDQAIILRGLQFITGTTYLRLTLLLYHYYRAQIGL